MIGTLTYFRRPSIGAASSPDDGKAMKQMIDYFDKASPSTAGWLRTNAPDSYKQIISAFLGGKLDAMHYQQVSAAYIEAMKAMNIGPATNDPAMANMIVYFDTAKPDSAGWLRANAKDTYRQLIAAFASGKLSAPDYQMLAAAYLEAKDRLEPPAASLPVSTPADSPAATTVTPTAPMESPSVFSNPYVKYGALGGAGILALLLAKRFLFGGKK